MKKKIIIIIVISIIIISTSLIFKILLNKINSKLDVVIGVSDNDFDQVKSERERIANEIINNDYYEDKEGWIELKEKDKYLSNSGYVSIVEFEKDKYAIYFFGYNGMGGESRGYLYEIEKNEFINKYSVSDRFNFILLERINAKWIRAVTND